MSFNGFPIRDEVLKALVDQKETPLMKEEAELLAGFVAAYAYAVPKVKKFLFHVMQESLIEAREINAEHMKELQEKLEKLKSKNKILN